ncbi:hypothetical protein, conserved [Trypanosoma brucei gambiense DAL972]|uniref:FHA domain-containing protein n=1 Tax=Trypanosoma brucei gambiense (strain MHOM/CI/86/DAL972) TaxID=679716 RepID=C9ZTC2_TRYB9|nr:hypothetical protein, conserved [Trypanosoma brucei gambiense DAL972]CBH12657.1 hypothetical protein, conserved [Trypanosoma brucei gambiense DAL972]|eukprot:XP_011774937.1 hypothetical protein, conserved [Trypanosoma brucei gambiense DAL972]
MWIVFMNGQARFWLVGGATYTVGSKECHITLAGDPSISRKHLTLRVGLLPSLAQPQELSNEEGKDLLPLIVTDTSKYGTELRSSPNRGGIDSDNDSTHAVERDVQLSGATPTRVKLSRGDSCCVPVNSALWRGFSMTLGARGTTLSLRWSPMRVFTVDNNDGCMYEWMSRCGAVTVSDIALADYLVTPHLTITPAAVAVLCRFSSHIVTPEYFKVLQEGRESNPQKELQDPRAYFPSVDSSWSALLSSESSEIFVSDNRAPPAAGEISAGLKVVLSDSSLKERRQRLFAGTTFVVVQQFLYDEVRVFLPFTQGCAVLDLSLLDAVDSCGDEAAVRAFYAKHCNHIVLYSDREELPVLGPLRTLQYAMGMCCVEHTAFIRSVVWLKPLPTLSLSSNVSPSGESEQPAACSCKSVERGSAYANPKQKDHRCEKKMGRGYDETERFPSEQTGRSATEEGQEMREEQECGCRMQGEMEREDAEEDHDCESNMILTQVETGRPCVGMKRGRVGAAAVGRLTDPNPLFQELWSDEEVDGYDDDDATGHHEQNTRSVGAGGWICRKRQAAEVGMDFTVRDGLAISSHPCLKRYAASLISSGGGGGGKWFKKQQLIECREKVELDRTETAPGVGSLMRQLAIDDVDIIPDAVGKAIRMDIRQLGTRHTTRNLQPRQQRRPKKKAPAQYSVLDCDTLSEFPWPYAEGWPSKTTSLGEKQMAKRVDSLNDLLRGPQSRRAPLSVFDLEAFL